MMRSYAYSPILAWITVSSLIIIYTSCTSYYLMNPMSVALNSLSSSPPCNSSILEIKESAPPTTYGDLYGPSTTYPTTILIGGDGNEGVIGPTIIGGAPASATTGGGNAYSIPLITTLSL